MKYSQWRSFEKHLRDSSPSHFADVYVVIAKDEFERKNGERGILHFLQMPSSLPGKILEGESISSEGLQGELRTFSLFSSGRQVLVVRNIDRLKGPPKGLLEQYLEKPSRSHYLVLTAENLPSNTHLYKKAEASGVILDLGGAEKAWEKEKRLEVWLQEQAAALGKPLDPQAAHLLLKHVGMETALLYQELEKLICYVGERPAIIPSDVEAISLRFPSETVWQFGEAIFRLQAGQAFQMARGLLTDANALIPLLRQLRTQFQTGFQVCSLITAGRSAQEVSAQFPYMKGALLQKNIELAMAFGLQRYKHGLIQIEQTEVQAKNSSLDADLLMDRLIAKLTTPLG